MSTGRAAALVIGLLAILVTGFLLFGRLTGCGSAIYPTDFTAAVAQYPAAAETAAGCRDALQIRRIGAAVAGVAGVGLVIYGLVDPDRARTTRKNKQAAPKKPKFIDTVTSEGFLVSVRSEERDDEQPTPPDEVTQADLTSQLKELRSLHDEGALDDDEYKAAKAKLLSEDGA